MSEGKIINHFYLSTSYLTIKHFAVLVSEAKAASWAVVGDEPYQGFRRKDWEAVRQSDYYSAVLHCCECFSIASCSSHRSY